MRQEGSILSRGRDQDPLAAKRVPSALVDARRAIGRLIPGWRSGTGAIKKNGPAVPLSNFAACYLPHRAPTQDESFRVLGNLLTQTHMYGAGRFVDFSRRESETTPVASGEGCPAKAGLGRRKGIGSMEASGCRLILTYIGQPGAERHSRISSQPSRRS